MLLRNFAFFLCLLFSGYLPDARASGQAKGFVSSQYLCSCAAYYENTVFPLAISVQNYQVIPILNGNMKEYLPVLTSVV